MADTTATSNAEAQAVTSRVEDALFGTPPTDEPIPDRDVVDEDALKELPSTDDTDLDDDPGSDGVDLDKIAEEEDEATLATYLGVEEDRIVVSEDGSVGLNTVIDGETKAVPLKDLVSSYQMQGHVNNKSMALETERKTFDTQRGEIAQQLKIRLDGVDALGKALEEQLVGEFKSIDWDRLRIEDSAEWTALRQEYSERAQKVQKVKALSVQERNRIQQETAQQSTAVQANYVNQQRSEMIAKNPAWTDSTVFKTDMDALRTFAAESYGFTENDMTQVYDHRLIELLKDAQSFRKGKKTVETKRISKLPKFQKPGAPKGNSKQLANARSIKAKRAAVTKSGGSVDSIANLIVDRM